MQRPRFLSPTALCVLFLLVISFLTYRPILAYFYTDVDTFDLIWIGRIYSFRDIPRIFSTHVGGGAHFYRPVSQLSFGIDNILWNDNPLGYHLTDLAIHSLNAVLLFLLGLRLLPPSRFSLAYSCLAGALFAVSRATLPVVASITNRHDSIAALFSLACLLVATNPILQGKRPLPSHVLSSLFGALAVFAKESTYLLPVLLASLCLIHHPAPAPTTRLRQALHWAAPLAVLVLFNAWLHIPVTGQMPSIASSLYARFKTAATYPFYLILPAGVPDPHHRWKVTLLLTFALLSALCFLSFRLRPRQHPLARPDRHLLKTSSWLLLFLTCYGLLYISFGHVSKRYVYTPTIAYSLLIVCLPLYQGTNTYLRWARRALALALVSYITLCSPLIVPSAAWERSSRISRNVVNSIHEALVHHLAAASQPTVYLVNLPVFLEYRDGIAQEGAGVLRDYNMDAWANINEKRHRRRVSIKTITHVRMQESPATLPVIDYQAAQDALLMRARNAHISLAGSGKVPGMPLTFESDGGRNELRFHRCLTDNEVILLFDGTAVKICDAQWVAEHVCRIR